MALFAAVGLTALAGCGISKSDPSTVALPPSASASALPSKTAMSGHDMGNSGGGAAAGGHEGDPGRGLLVSENGYTLKPTTSRLKVGAQIVSFQILDADGLPQTDYTLDQTKLLHFYLVRQDLTGYQHLHPTLSDGTWSIAVQPLSAGPYRMYADFIAKNNSGTDTAAVLSTTLSVPGNYTPTALPAAATSVTADGLTATLTGSLAAGTASKVSVQITDNGTPVTDLEQYLDSFAHLTAVHAEDLAYRHVHPGVTAKPGQKGGPTLPFTVDLPEKGTWRLFLQVQRGGTLHLLPLTVTVS